MDGMESEQKNYPGIAKQYAEDICSGKRIACEWTIAACRRHLADLETAELESYRYYFNEAAATRACKIIELFPHIKGKWAGTRIELEPWQIFIVSVVFGWADKETELRRFRTVYIEVPRKNAKSTLSSAIGLLMAFLDGEGGAEVYSAATTRDQAKIVFADAQRMARKTPRFLSKYGVAVNARNIHQIETASKFEPLSAEGNSLDGLNVHCGIIDELHAHKTRSVFDVIETATGAREQPLIWLITTAGSNRAGICYEQRAYVVKILSGVHSDDTYFGIIYSIDKDDDWTDPAVWEKANPNYGISVYPEDIARLCAKAQQMPSAQNNFLTKRLNVWVNADTAWMEMRSWDACGDPTLSITDFTGERAIAALDLASRVDIAAKLLVFEKDQNYYAFGKYYLPEETVENNANSQYEGWANEGRLTTTPGNIIDFSYIEDDLKEDASQFEIIEVAYDPFQATQFSTRMADEGFEMIEVRPTTLNFSEPMKELEALVLSDKFHHDGCPILSWMVSNVVCHLDNKDNIYPRKERVENKIDGVVALIMALNRYMNSENEGSLDDYLASVNKQKDDQDDKE